MMLGTLCLVHRHVAFLSPKICPWTATGQWCTFSDLNGEAGLADDGLGLTGADIVRCGGPDLKIFEKNN